MKQNFTVRQGALDGHRLPAKRVERMLEEGDLLLLGGHLLISALNYDIAHIPRRPLHPQLSPALEGARR